MKFLLAILIRVQHFVDWVAHENNIIIIIMAYTAAFPQTGIQVISASDIEQAVSTGEILLLFSRSAVGSLKSPVLG